MTPMPITFTDEVLLFGLSRYYGLRKGRGKSSAGIVIATLLLTLYRVKGPIRRNDLMAAAGMSHITPITFRTYIHYLRQCLGQEAIYLNGLDYQLSFEARADMDKAFKFIQEELEEAIRPKVRKAVLALVRTA